MADASLFGSRRFLLHRSRFSNGNELLRINRRDIHVIIDIGHVGRRLMLTLVNVSICVDFFVN